MTLIPICRVTALSSRSVGIDGAKLRILFLFLLLKQKKITNCLEYRRKMPIFATCNRLQSLARARKENQVEPRCAERWHLCDDEQFDLAAWFPSLNTFRPCHSVAGSDSIFT